MTLRGTGGLITEWKQSHGKMHCIKKLHLERGERGKSAILHCSKTWICVLRQNKKETFPQSGFEFCPSPWENKAALNSGGRISTFWFSQREYVLLDGGLPLWILYVIHPPKKPVLQLARVSRTSMLRQIEAVLYFHFINSGPDKSPNARALNIITRALAPEPGAAIYQSSILLSQWHQDRVALWPFLP